MLTEDDHHDIMAALGIRTPETVLRLAMMPPEMNTPEGDNPNYLFGTEGATYGGGRSMGPGSTTPITRIAPSANENVKFSDEDYLPLARTIQNKLNVFTPKLVPATEQEMFQQRFDALRNRLLPSDNVRIIPDNVMSALKKQDYLGFDRPGQALNALRDDLKAGKDIRKTWDFRSQDNDSLRQIMEYLAQ